MKSDSPQQNLRFLLRFFLVILLAGLVLSLFFVTCRTGYSTAVAWILAMSVSGMGIGFLFGIPKILQANGQATGADVTDGYHMQVNTNLTDISDWLTKIIVGLGLVQLGHIAEYVKKIATAMSKGICAGNEATSLAFSYSIIIGYFIAGFLFGYLMTRLFLSKAFSRADQEAMQQLTAGQEALQAQLLTMQNNLQVQSQKLYPEQTAPVVAQDVPVEPMAALTPPPLPAIGPLDKLVAMAHHYMEINPNNYGERVKQKDAAANDMINYAFDNGITREQITGKMSIPPEEGLVLTLAGMIALRPQPKDFALLQQYGAALTRKHVRFRVLSAVVALAEKELLSEEDKVQASTLLETYKKDADGSLLKMIDYTSSMLKTR
ncbi:hypothetical protein [Chitinophaga sp. sic0106]|uniref:hypothetical protein n=1 Tax=Chitinophaga sp. sic0106 TaxID=2854785 RepID=UPI001C43D789|nr:hypothetical protein [Chitinophaga sp. sic0106]MBV7530777.1 hypothetical protein [Chitinophaga sp. sic0106]